MKIMTGVHDGDSRQILELLQGTIYMYAKNPDISAKLKRAFDSLLKNKRTIDKLDAALSILQYCGDFETQCSMVRMLLQERDTNRYKCWFASFWFNSMPGCGTSFISLQEPNDQDVAFFVQEYNSHQPKPYVFSFRCTLVTWNNSFILSSGKGLSMFSVNVGSQFICINGLSNIPAELRRGESLKLQINTISCVKICYLPLCNNLIQAMCIESSIGHLVVHPYPLVDLEKWGTVRDLLKSIANIDFEILAPAAALEDCNGKLILPANKRLKEEPREPLEPADGHQMTGVQFQQTQEVQLVSQDNLIETPKNLRNNNLYAQNDVSCPDINVSNHATSENFGNCSTSDKPVQKSSISQDLTFQSQRKNGNTKKGGLVPPVSKHIKPKKIIGKRHTNKGRTSKYLLKLRSRGPVRQSNSDLGKKSHINTEEHQYQQETAQNTMGIAENFREEVGDAVSSNVGNGSLPLVPCDHTTSERIVTLVSSDAGSQQYHHESTHQICNVPGVCSANEREVAITNVKVASLQLGVLSELTDSDCITTPVSGDTQAATPHHNANELEDAVTPVLDTSSLATMQTHHYGPCQGSNENSPEDLKIVCITEKNDSCKLTSPLVAPAVEKFAEVGPMPPAVYLYHPQPMGCPTPIGSPNVPREGNFKGAIQEKLCLSTVSSEDDICFVDCKVSPKGIHSSNASPFQSLDTVPQPPKEVDNTEQQGNDILCVNHIVSPKGLDVSMSSSIVSSYSIQQPPKEVDLAEQQGNGILPVSHMVPSPATDFFFDSSISQSLEPASMPPETINQREQQGNGLVCANFMGIPKQLDFFSDSSLSQSLESVPLPSKAENLQEQRGS